MWASHRVLTPCDEELILMRPGERSLYEDTQLRASIRGPGDRRKPRLAGGDPGGCDATFNGGQLGLAQRDFRIFDNFLDTQANDNTTPHLQFPGYAGAEMAIWKACVEWGSTLHGDGSGDPHQPSDLGSGNANFDPSFQEICEGGPFLLFFEKTIQRGQGLVVAGVVLHGLLQVRHGSVRIAKAGATNIS